jgi:ornithine cyclodeaminase
LTTVLDLDDIKPLVDTPALIDEIERGFVLYSEGKVKVPPVGFLHVDEPPADVHIKYGYVVGNDYWVLKIASSFYDNPSIGLPMADGLLLVFSQKTGELKLILLDKCWLTDMRTAAAGAVAARHLAPKKIEAIGIVGTGTQARMQLELLKDEVECGRCLIWGRNPDKVAKMIDDLGDSEIMNTWGIDIAPASELDHLTAECNLIVTTTPAKTPLIDASQVRKGTHITAMGSDDLGKQELGANVLAAADLVVADSIAQCIDHGECLYAVRDGLIEEGSVVELGDVIANPGKGRTSDDQVTVADLTGVAIQDIQIAKMVDRARLAE